MPKGHGTSFAVTGIIMPARILRRQRRLGAGALGLQLAGDAWYFGERYHKPTIGDAVREIEDADIIRANCLMYGAAVLCLVICVIIRYLLVG